MKNNNKLNLNIKKHFIFNDIMKTLHITNHIGTKRNIENVFEYLGILDKLHTENLYGKSFLFLNGIDYNEIQNIWENYKEKIKEYDCIFFSDTILFALPFLKNLDKHDLKIIIYITNRFDFSIQDENIRIEYSNIFNSNSNNGRVFFCSDNKFDQYYASLYGINPDIIRLTPYIHNEILLPTNEKLFVYNRGTKINYYHSFLIQQDIDFEVFGEGIKRYKDEKEITQFIGYLHLPYQTNIQSLWENLGYSILYFIPSKHFMKKIVLLDWYYFEEKYFICDKKNGSQLLNTSIELSEWYQPENEGLFEFFDSWEHLKKLMESYKKDSFKSKLLEKKKRIQQLVQLSNKKNIEKWREICFT